MHDSKSNDVRAVMCDDVIGLLPVEGVDESDPREEIANTDQQSDNNKITVSKIIM